MSFITASELKMETWFTFNGVKVLFTTGKKFSEIQALTSAYMADLVISAYQGEIRILKCRHNLLVSPGVNTTEVIP